MDKQLQDKILSVMSQSELGRRLGKKPQTVSLWFKGRVPGEEVLRTSEALEWRVTPHDLRRIFTQTQMNSCLKRKQLNCW